MHARVRRAALAVLAGVLALGTAGVVHQVSAPDGRLGSTFQAAPPPPVTPARFSTRATTARAVERAPVKPAPAPKRAATKPARKPAKKAPLPQYCIGAAAMARADCPPSTSVSPLGKAAWEDFGPAYDQKCVTLMPWEPAKYRRCVYFGGTKTENRPSIAVVGNSHAIHYLPPLLVLAERHNWRLTTYFANKCFPTTVPLDLPERHRENCLAWGKWVLEDTKAGGFDLIVTSNRQGPAPLNVSRAKSHPVWKKGYRHYVDAWLDAGTRVVVIRDNPYPGHTRTVVPDCVAANRKNWRKCGAPRQAWLRPDPLAEAALAADSPRARVANLTPLLCKAVCPPVIGNILVYRDESHLTATFSRTLAPYLGPHLRRALNVR